MGKIRTHSKSLWFWGGFIQTEPMDLGIDLWVDTLGALAVCFLYDEFSQG
jgi:hypothetical protein